MPIRDLPASERPRERLFLSGAASLSNAELLAIVMATSGQRGESVLALAERVLGTVGGLENLSQANLESLSEVKGIGPAKASLLLALVELSRRMSTKKSESTCISSPEQVRDLLIDRFRFEEKERFFSIILNTKNRVIGIEEISVGSLNSSIVHPREVFKTAVRKSAASIIVAHNHPSGDTAPSREDVEVTRRLCEAGRLLGVELLDHVIFGDSEILSLKQKGLM
ncbi:MAG TPA: DNA repair protein RadC [Bacillota bacterium]|nr:DNA repair protein RadC [Bacillota bacterium]